MDGSSLCSVDRRATLERAAIFLPSERAWETSAGDVGESTGDPRVLPTFSRAQLLFTVDGGVGELLLVNERPNAKAQGPRHDGVPGEDGDGEGVEVELVVEGQEGGVDLLVGEEDLHGGLVLHAG
eukprot:CAMPEP_0197403608 /NCGR_PEP_ID=MMETSP1165-20131217/21763_1 /TAXON_ID=284809 /ORGANISM="Chrysocystis fragilis, Strain CCMP3189" /LENGTH=124 /DNA_ID=CAMNT_0042929829 /DNA_START=24 /DNA_END=394 /DNA_ORIENTATION=-